MRTLLMRERLPDRRRSWTQKVNIGGHKVYLCVGEYEDGRPGEIFVDISKEGTFLRGVMDAWARTASIALQCGADIEVIIHAVEELCFIPDGEVKGSSYVTECTSIIDWVAQELKAKYTSCSKPTTNIGEGDVSPLKEKVAGHISESWRVGA